MARAHFSRYRLSAYRLSRYRFAAAAALAATSLAACDSTSTRINPEPTPAARSYDCDTRGGCGSNRLGAPTIDSRGGPGPSGEELRRDAPTMR